MRGLFGVEWDFPSVEPPAYLMRLAPDIYRQEQDRVAQRFEEAVRLAEQAFVAEFARLVSHLTERLSDGDGERRIFRDSVVTNLGDFFERFRQLNVRSNEDLDGLVAQAQQLVGGVTPQDLRDNAGLRQHVATEMAVVQSRLDDPVQKIMFVEGRWVRAAGGRAVADHVDGNVYLALSLRNVGSGIGVCQGWTGGAGLTYKINGPISFITRYEYRHYDVGQDIFKRNSYRASIGFAFSPRDVPLTLW